MIGGTRRGIVANRGRDSWDVWLDLQRPEGTRRGAPETHESASVVPTASATSRGCDAGQVELSGSGRVRQLTVR